MVEHSTLDQCRDWSKHGDKNRSSNTHEVDRAKHQDGAQTSSCPECARSAGTQVACAIQSLQYWSELVSVMTEVMDLEQQPSGSMSKEVRLDHLTRELWK